jgi:hypothetical protein
VAERRIALLNQRALAMMKQAGLNEKAMQDLRAEFTDTANVLENITATSTSEKSAYEKWTGEKSKLFPYLIQPGRIGYAVIRKKMKGKWKEKRQKGVMVGYAKNHSADTYRMYMPKTNRIEETRDVVWADWKRPSPGTGMSIFDKEPTLKNEPTGLDDKENTTTVDIEIEISPKVNIIPDDEDTEKVTTKVTEEQKASAKADRLQRELSKLQTSYNPEAERIMKNPTVIESDTDGTERETQVHFVFNINVSSDFGEPNTVNEAITGEYRDKWIPAIASELMNFIKRGGWKKVPRIMASEMGKTIIPTKWVFKVKDEPDGSKRYKARCVSKGYKQIPGVDYTESFSPVATDTSVRTALAMTLFQRNWDCEVIDIEAAFLEGSIEEPTFIEWPEGMEEFGFITDDEKQEYVIQLMKSMYGNVDAALRFFKELKKHIQSSGNMQQSKTDPCVFMHFNEEQKLDLLVVTHVDDQMLCGTKTARETYKDMLSKRFKWTSQGRLRKHLGVRYEWMIDENGDRLIVATMKKLVNEIIQAFEKATGKPAKLYNTPGTPGVSMTKNTGSVVKQEQYRSIVGKYMYLVVKLFVEGSNTARELSKHFSNPGEEQWKELARAIGFLKKYKNEVKLIYRKPKELRTGAMVDSNYGTNKDDRRSVSAAIHTLGGTIINWFSKTQPTVALSSSEAEYLAASSAVQEILFEQSLLSECGVCQKPGIMLDDNEGAIFLIRNQAVGTRTKHIDIRYHFIRDHFEKKEFDVTYIDTETNESDIITKNTTEQVHMKHAVKIRNGKLHLYEKSYRSGDPLGAKVRPPLEYRDKIKTEGYVS